MAVTAFSPDKRSSTGLSSRCKACNRRAGALNSANYKRRRKGLKPLPSDEYLAVPKRLDPEIYDYSNMSYLDHEEVRNLPPEWYWQHFINMYGDEGRSLIAAEWMGMQLLKALTDERPDQ